MTTLQTIRCDSECRVEIGGCALTLNREQMPPRSFQVLLTYRNGDGENAARFACGFSVYMDAREQTFSVLTRIALRLIRVAPIALDDGMTEHLRAVAGTWIDFNFRHVLDAPRIREQVKAMPAKREVARAKARDDFRVDAWRFTFGTV